MIFVRCDDRLVHGQLLFKWVNKKKIKNLIIVDDKTASDIIERNMVIMTKPRECNLKILNSNQMYEINTETEDNTMILFKNISVACLFINLNKDITEINIGRMASEFGKVKVFNNIFLSNKEIRNLKKLINNNIKVYSQTLPNENLNNLNEIIERIKL